MAKLGNESEVRVLLSEQTDSDIKLQFVPSGDPTIVKEYLDWLPRTKKAST